MCYFATSNFRVDCSNTSCINSYSCSLCRVSANCHITTKNTIKGVITINKNARSKLSKRCTYTGHDWRWDIDFKKGGRIIISPYVTHTCFFWIISKQCCRDHHIHYLWRLIYFSCASILHKVLVYYLS